MPPIRPVLCSMGAHKSDETHINFPSKYGGTYDCLHRRHTSDGGVPSAGEGPPGGINLSADRPGVCHQHTEVDHNPSSTTLHLSLPGEKLHHIRSEIDQMAKKSSQITARQLAQIIGKLHAASQAVLPAPLFYRSLQGDLQRALNSSSQNYNSLLTLSQPAQEELTWWQDKLTHWNGKALLHQTETMSIKSDASLQGWGAVCNGTRTGGPWSHAEQQMHINCLELLAATLAVKAFLKDHGGVSVRLQLDNQTAVAYINNMGGTVSPQLTSLSKALWMWALSKDIVLTAEYIPGSTNCVADTRVQDLKGSNRLEAQSSTIQSNRSEPGSPGSGPVCFPSVYSTSSVFQLETRPNGRGNRCLQPAVGEPERLCESSMVPDRQGSVTSEEPTSSSDPSGSGLEGPTMVSSPAGDVVQLSATASLVTEPIAVRAQRGPDGFSTPTSRVACLRQKFGCRNLSESAKELILSSWRGKTSKAYDFHFQKWLGWCSERGCDPISGPISDVINFLADLHSQGYQTNFLNAYRLAISSVHDKVDDMDVGKHPLVARLLKGAFHARPPLP